MSRFPRPLIPALAVLMVAIAYLPAMAQPRQRPGQPGDRSMMMGMMGRGVTLIAVAGNEQVRAKLGIEAHAEAIGKLAEEGRAQRGRGFPEGFRNMTPEQREEALKGVREARETALKNQDAKLKALLGKAKYNQLVEIRAGLVLQQTGPTAVLDPSIAALLKLTDEDKQKIQKVIEKYNADLRKLFEGVGPARRGGARGAREGAGGPSVSPQVIFVAAEGDGERRPGRPDMEEMRAKMAELRKTVNKAISEILTKTQKDEIARLIKAVDGIELRRGGRPRGDRQPGQGDDRPRRPRGGGDRPQPQS